MSTSIDRHEASRLLDGLENGGLAADDAGILAQNLDPVLVHLIVKFLRESYPASHPAANAVLDRVVALTAAYPAIVTKSKEGELDSVSEWFEDEYTFADFFGRGRELIDTVVEKLDS